MAGAATAGAFCASAGVAMGPSARKAPPAGWKVNPESDDLRDPLPLAVTQIMQIRKGRRAHPATWTIPRIKPVIARPRPTGRPKPMAPKKSARAGPTNTAKTANPTRNAFASKPLAKTIK